MAKKVKCANCMNASRFAMPSRKYIELNPDSYEWYKSICLRAFCCDITSKTKRMENEQYCKYYQEADEFHKKFNQSIEKAWNERFHDIEERKYKEAIVSEMQKVWKDRVVRDFMKGCR